MSKRYIYFGFLLSVFMLPFSFSFVSAVENTEDIETLTVRISELLNTVAELQKQLLLVDSGDQNISNYQFYRNLTVGDRGEDVKELQKLLNSNPKTAVALSLDGSKGLETLYFGSLTAKAVIKYQELNKKEILTPVGLSFGSGFVGPSTIAYLNKNSSKSVVNSAETIKNTTKTKKTEEISSGEESLPSFSFDLDKDNGVKPPEVFTVSPAIGPIGTSVTIHGRNFTSTGNVVSFGFGENVTAISKDGKKIFVTIEANGLLFGRPEEGKPNEWPLYVRVSNKNGESGAPRLFIIKN